MRTLGQHLDPSAWVPNAGTKLVIDVMNAVKATHPFIDLLKPESTAAVPLLLALEPGYRSHVGRLARLALSAREHTLRTPSLPTRSGDIAARGYRRARNGGLQCAGPVAWFTAYRVGLRAPLDG